MYTINLTKDKRAYRVDGDLDSDAGKALIAKIKSAVPNGMRQRRAAKHGSPAHFRVDRSHGIELLRIVDEANGSPSRDAMLSNIDRLKREAVRSALAADGTIKALRSEIQTLGVDAEKAAAASAELRESLEEMRASAKVTCATCPTVIETLDADASYTRSLDGVTLCADCSSALASGDDAASEQDAAAAVPPAEPEPPAKSEAKSKAKSKTKARSKTKAGT